jgi:hypothetical protein
MESGSVILHAGGMRCRLELRSPSNGTGWAESWNFSGADGRTLRGCLDALGDYVTDAPVERHTYKDGHVIEAQDRWRAAMLLWPDEPSQRQRITSDPVQADVAWTREGAMRLAEVLPGRLDDLRAAILARFGGSARRCVR